MNAGSLPFLQHFTTLARRQHHHWRTSNLFFLDRMTGSIVLCFVTGVIIKTHLRNFLVFLMANVSIVGMMQ